MGEIVYLFGSSTYLCPSSILARSILRVLLCCVKSELLLVLPVASTLLLLLPALRFCTNDICANYRCVRLQTCPTSPTTNYMHLYTSPTTNYTCVLVV